MAVIFSMSISMLYLCVCGWAHFHEMVHSPGDIIVSALCFANGCTCQYLVITMAKLLFIFSIRKIRSHDLLKQTNKKNTRKQKQPSLLIVKPFFRALNLCSTLQIWFSAQVKES